jgi:hypothetical protein
MRVSQQTGYLYFCNCNSTYGTLEFQRAKLNASPFQQGSMYQVYMGSREAKKCLDIDFKPSVTLSGVPIGPEPVVYFTAFHNLGWIMFFEVRFKSGALSPSRFRKLISYNPSFG